MPENIISTLLHSRPVWDRLRSLFSNRDITGQRHYYDADVADSAILWDLDHTKLVQMKILREDEMEPLHHALRVMYMPLVTLYRWYAAQEDEGDPFAVSLTEFFKLAEDCNIIDEVVTQEDIKTEFMVTNVELEAGTDDDADTLSRTEFIEMLVRIANRKFIQTGICSSIVDALNTLYDTHVVPYCEQHEIRTPDDFRRDSLYSEAYEQLFEEHEDTCERLFRDHSSQRNDGHNLMTLSQFLGVLRDSDIFNRHFQPRHAVSIFAQSMLMTETSNATPNNTMLGFVDFLEALVRVVDYHLTVIPHNSNQSVLTEFPAFWREIMSSLYSQSVHGSYVLKKRRQKKPKRTVGKHHGPGLGLVGKKELASPPLPSLAPIKPRRFPGKLAH